jgi:hypothetical protein
LDVCGVPDEVVVLNNLIGISFEHISEVHQAKDARAREKNSLGGS